MNSLKSRIMELKPAIILFYLSFTGFLASYSVQAYLDLRFDPSICLVFMGMVFGIYTFNRFTDAAEDFANDIGKFLFFQKKKFFFAMAVAALLASTGVLLASEKLNWLHALLLASGFCYSYRLLPWYSRELGLHMVRIKEIMFVKNLVVSMLWTASVLIFPILYATTGVEATTTLYLLGGGLFLAILNNTLFHDIMDESGDRIAGIRTLPTIWGTRNSLGLLWVLDGLWLAGMAGCWWAGLVDGKHAVFLSMLTLFPLFYTIVHAVSKSRKEWMDFVSESDLMVFSFGLLMLKTW